MGDSVSTSTRTAAVPSRKEQPGLGRAANPSRDPKFGPTPRRPTTRRVTAQDRRAARRERLGIEIEE